MIARADVSARKSILFFAAGAVRITFVVFGAVTVIAASAVWSAMTFFAALAVVAALAVFTFAIGIVTFAHFYSPLVFFIPVWGIFRYIPHTGICQGDIFMYINVRSFWA